MWNDSGRAATQGCRVTAFRVRLNSKHKPSQFIRFETHEFPPSRFLQPVIPQRTSDRNEVGANPG